MMMQIKLLITQATRDIFKKVAKREDIPLKEGTYMRMLGPNYESPEMVYWLRSVLRGMWEEGNRQAEEKRFNGNLVGMAGMSTIYEKIAAQHATQSKTHPAFQEGKSWVATVTNYAAGLGPEGILPPPDHEEVKQMAAKVREHFGRLVNKAILEMRRKSVELVTA